MIDFPSARILLAITLLFSSQAPIAALQEDTMIKRYLTTDTIYILCKSIYEQATCGDNPFVPDLIVGLSRGGLVPVGFLAGEQMFNNRHVKIISITSYDDTKHQSDIQLLFPFGEQELEHLSQFKSILVVDDLVDSGKSLAWTLNLLRTALPHAQIRTAVLFYKKSSIIMPDYYAETADKWLVFPWEK